MNCAVAADVTVNFAPGDGDADGGQKVENGIPSGGKRSVLACSAVNQNYSGAATITSNQPIVVIGKVYGAGLGSAWVGDSAGDNKLALPYVRWSETKYASGEYQRAFIAIQNVGGAALTNVTVKYLDKTGGLVGTHTIATIDPGKKASSNPTLASGDTVRLKEFGNPEGNPGGGFGGAAIVEASGGTIIAIARIQSAVGAGRVVEDYNGIQNIP